MDQIAYNKQLIEKYPWLLPRNVWTDKVEDNYDYSYTLLDEMPDGWRKAFGEQLCEELQQALLKDGEQAVKDYRIEQIKEKYAALRWYDNYSTEATRKVIDKYEVLSMKTCIQCGKPATKYTCGWIVPICDTCGNSSTARYIPLERVGM